MTSHRRQYEVNSTTRARWDNFTDVNQYYLVSTKYIISQAVHINNVSTSVGCFVCNGRLRDSIPDRLAERKGTRGP